jgi:protein ImuB
VVACIFVPDFPAAAIVRNEPELQGQAIAIVEGAPPLLSVVAANERARQAGVEAGMTKLQAAARLAAYKKDAQQAAAIRQRSLVQEAAAHAALSDCARAFSPRVEEPANAPDMVLLDLAGLERLFGTPRTLAPQIARRAMDFGLGANVAIAANLDATICAAHGFTGATILAASREAEQLASLPVEVLVRSADPELTGEPAELLETFDRWGIRTFRDFAALPRIAIAQRLGPAGIYLQQLARGEGTRTLAPTGTALQFEEAIELEYPIDDLDALAFVLNRLLEQLCARLSARALSTNELQLRMKLENCGERQVVDDYERTIRLPVPMLDARTFLRLWQLELRANPPSAPVAEVRMRAEAVQPRFTQGGLFLPTAPEPERLELTLARIAGVLHCTSQTDPRAGCAEVLDSHRPDAFRVKRFGSDVARPSSAVVERNSSHSNIVTALRRFRPPVRVTVETSDGHPVRLRAACDLLPPECEVTWCSGPWRSSGEWWNQPWSREEWDVAVSDVFCRIYRDTINECWFLEGTYD